MLAKFKKEINRLIPDISTAKLFIAISGGVDSIVLTELCIAIGIKPVLLHCNFSLRGKESDEDELFIINYAKAQNLEQHIKKFDTKLEAKNKKINIQECARKLRYDWFKSFTNSTQNFLLTAHHLNDVVETFHINTLRGTGLKGLKSIPEKRAQIIRPLLCFTKQEVKEYAALNSIEYREDSSNSSDKYLRNKIRQDLIPKFEQLDQDYHKKMYTLVDELNQIDNYLDSITQEYNAKLLHNSYGKTLSIKIELLSNIPSFLFPRIFKSHGVLRSNSTQLQNLFNSSTGTYFNTKSFTFLKNRNEILIKPVEVKSEKEYTIQKTDKTLITNIGILKLEFTSIIPLKFEKHIAYFDANKIEFPLKLTSNFIGQKIQPLGMKGKKLVSDVLIDKKVNRLDKEKQLLLISGEHTIWVIGLCVSEAHKISSSTKNILKVTFSE